jgi:hypothetical protein
VLFHLLFSFGWTKATKKREAATLPLTKGFSGLQKPIGVRGMMCSYTDSFPLLIGRRIVPHQEIRKKPALDGVRTTQRCQTQRHYLPV